jgi:hypothetical protein
MSVLGPTAEFLSLALPRQLLHAYPGSQFTKLGKNAEWIPDDSTGTQMSQHHLADHRPPEEQRIMLAQLPKGELGDALHAILCGDCHNPQALGIFWSHVWQPLSRLWDLFSSEPFLSLA